MDAAVGAPTAQGVVWFHSEANCRQLRRNGVNSKATHTLVHTHARLKAKGSVGVCNQVKGKGRTHSTGKAEAVTSRAPVHRKPPVPRDAD